MTDAFPHSARKTAPLFDMALALILVLGLGIALNGCATDAPPQPPHDSRPPLHPAPSDEPRQLKRGINLSRWWEAENDRALDSSDIQRLQAMGFDFVRLPLDPQALNPDNSDDPSQANALKAALRLDLNTLTEAGFNVVLDLHPKGDFQRRLTSLPPGEARQKLETVWRELNEIIKDLPPERLLLEILNEPKFGTSRWWKIQEELIVALRKIYPRNAFIATTSPDSGWWQLASLKPYKDPNVIYDFHFYEPMTFTHHEVEWANDYDPKRAEIPIPYPVPPTDADDPKTNDPAIRAYLKHGWNREKIARLVKKIAEWKTKHKTTIACLEFGVYRKHVDDESRLGWLRDLREELEQNGIPWAMWEYKGPFGLLPDDAGHGDTPKSALTDALGLKSGDQP